MRRLLVKTVAGLLLAGPVVARPLAEEGPWTLRLCANTSMGSPADSPSAAYELMRRVQAQWPGLRVEYTLLPWSRCLQEAEEGRFDGVLAASWTAERAARLVYPRRDDRLDEELRLFRLGYALLRRKGSGVHWDGERFVGTETRAGRALGAERGYAVVSFARERGAAVEDRFPNATSLVEALKIGRVAGVLVAQEHAAVLLRDPEFARDHEIDGGTLQSRAYFIPVSHALWQTEPERVQRLWAVAAQVRQSAGFRQAYSLILSGGERRDLRP